MPNRTLSDYGPVFCIHRPHSSSSIISSVVSSTRCPGSDRGEEEILLFQDLSRTTSRHKKMYYKPSPPMSGPAFSWRRLVSRERRCDIGANDVARGIVENKPSQPFLAEILEVPPHFFILNCPNLILLITFN
ncbi:DNA topoisomerase 1 [Striga asiatica]|uniref:DNA topoisomerase 1 n=1 Tax=Striga asiatica TaxID=4170 RepID=A0A5A7QLY4_STRAF|nr:DNA topoisomerase 1 [Striga asiatica]